MDKFPTIQSFQRLDDFPLDETSISDTFNNCTDYISNNPTSYKGQIIHIQDARTAEESNLKSYEETFYVDLYKELEPICTFNTDAFNLLFDILHDLNKHVDTIDKVNELKEMTFDTYTHKYDSLEEFPTGDYHTQPWHI